MFNTSTVTQTPANLTAPLPSAAPHGRCSDVSALSAILALLALIAIPSLIYAFFFAIKCPQNPFRRLRRSFGGIPSELAVRSSGTGKTEFSAEVVKYLKVIRGKENGGECTVCLSAFVEGEEIKQLNACKHAFHIPCIDKWLSSHSSCPVCRASIGVRTSKSPAAADGDDDLRRGIPDAATLV